MSELTPEQRLAVEKRSTNIIVSAGAGSGKTTVLKTRVLRILKSGIPINKLIILTFTKNAAREMKERIRNIILDNEDVISNLELIDSSYITTFDSFASSLVKKYNYLLNIDKSFSIIDSNLINTEKKRILDEIFEEKYANDDEFKKLIKVFCMKNDNIIRKDILLAYDSLVNIIERDKFLSDEVLSFFSSDKTEDLFKLYENYLFNLINDINELYEDLQSETLDNDTLTKNNELINKLLSASSYDEIKDSIGFSLAKYTEKRYTDYGKTIKDKISETQKAIKKYLFDDNKKELISKYQTTESLVKVVIDILKILDERLMKFKYEHNAYEFHDIAFKAIELVKNHRDVRDNLKNNTYEIMIDEYQDTNDIQETFISYISNNNVYMVGDIKQSIYRFRNANPYIFKKKYDNYKENKDGFKIDLNSNFRSREEVIKAINLIFGKIMFDNIGGANYQDEHEMSYGNDSYDKFKLNKNYNLEILSYSNTKQQYLDSEAECFMIADDINKRINSHEQVVDEVMGEKIARDITYKDFVILADKSKHFDLLKRILESKNIPTTIDKDISIKEEDEIYILKNLINLIILLKRCEYKEMFKHAWISIARSYLFNMSDDEIFDVFQNNSFLKTDIIKKLKHFVDLVDSLGIYGLLNKLIDEFNFIERIITDGDCRNKLSKLEIFINNAKSLNDFGMDIYSINEYFDELLESDNDFKMTSNIHGGNTVTIMTIHGSKGLEYPIVYLPFLNNDFTRRNYYPTIELTNNFGIITPFNDNGYGKTFASLVYNLKERVEDLSERIRLFYVALTRAKEKLVIINKQNEKIVPTINLTYNDLISVKTYNDIINMLSITLSPYIRNVDLSKLGIDKSYNENRNIEFNLGTNSHQIEVQELVIDNKEVDNKHFSSSITKVIDENLHDRLEFGTKMHYCFEVCDFKNDNINELNVDEEIKIILRNFLAHEEVKNIKEATIYKEKEIWYQDQEHNYHGFIDLLLVYDDHADIIDYKLSNLDSDKYKEQLTGYKNYIESVLQLPTSIYLYSINKDIFKKL